MAVLSGRNHASTFFLTMLLMTGVSARLDAQSVDEDEFTIRDSSVGYIDSAVVGDQIRMRFDAGYGLNRPNRAEFFYAKAAPGIGLPMPESNIDYQDLSIYLEKQLASETSLFVELGPRFLNPALNDNTAGLADMNCGLKHELRTSENWLLTGQLKIYIPTGDSVRGLGTNHTSLEPGLLTIYRLDESWSVSGEFRYWIPVGGTDFAGEIFRYGIGLQKTLELAESRTISPVVELVSWTVLNGKVGFLTGGSPAVADASGDTVTNLKLGSRIGLTQDSDLYLGYGRCLTGDRWYQDVFRAEFRWSY
ncbi:MAG TPA: transporter [Planctomycetaceae bacterium]|nr:transporter [Planctomycetaceae bacterium]